MTTNRQNTKRNNFSFGFRDRKKPISKVIKGLPVDYKDVDVLISYISDRAKITSSYRTGNEAKDHRSLTKAIKRARHMALLPISCLLYTSPSPRDRTRSRMPSSA